MNRRFPKPAESSSILFQVRQEFLHFQVVASTIIKRKQLGLRVQRPTWNGSTVPLYVSTPEGALLLVKRPRLQVECLIPFNQFLNF